MTDPKPPMVAYPVSANGAPCPSCGGSWSATRCSRRSPKGVKCGVNGCVAQRFEECRDAAGEVTAVACLKGCRWRKSDAEKAPTP